MHRRAILKLLATAAALPAGVALARAQNQAIRISTVSGFDGTVLDFVKQKSPTKGIALETAAYRSYEALAKAIDGGQIDGGILGRTQLAEEVRKAGLNIVPVGVTTGSPLGIYSAQYPTWDAVPAETTVAIPNDAYNRGRALLLLRDRDAIGLREGAGPEPTLADVTRNPKRLRFVEVAAADALKALSPTNLDPAGLAAILPFYAKLNGLRPADALLLEDKAGPHASVLAVRGADTGKPWIGRFFDAYRTDEVKAFIDRQFDGLLVASW